MKIQLEVLEGASLTEAREWIKDCDWPDLESDEVDGDYARGASAL